MGKVQRLLRRVRKRLATRNSEQVNLKGWKWIDKRKSKDKGKDNEQK